MIAFDDTYMGAGEPLKGSRFPGFGASNRKPETSRNGRHRQKALRPKEAGRKGLSRSSVAVVRSTTRIYQVRVKGTRALVGLVEKYYVDGKPSYLYNIPGTEPVKGFKRQTDAVDAMLRKS